MVQPNRTEFPVCWDPSDIGDIIMITAENPSPSVFLATHLPAPIRRTTTGTSNDYWRTTEEEILESFLDPDRDQTFVPILGASGSGKSHLVRWMWSRIEETDDRRVIRIPRYETNLRDVISRVLEGAEGDQYVDFRERLNNASRSLTPELARAQFLAHLRTYIQQHEPEDPEISRREIRVFQSQLPMFLGDPSLEETLFQEGGFIDRVVSDALEGQRDIDTAGELPEFEVDDLPLEARNLDQLGGPARGFYGQLIGNRALQRKTVEWINACIPAALRNLYSLDPGDLQKLLRDLRVTLLEQGTELVLLVEDFVVLQGIQHELLAAMIDDVYEEGEKVLCTMRTALAVTTGYFDRLATPETRTTFKVDLDVATEHLDSDGDRTLVDFFGRYLNAVRLGKGQVEAAWESVSGNAAIQEWLPNGCEGCPVRQHCHQAFGATEEGFGLYPFNRTAIEKLTERATPATFNPRSVLRNVVGWVLHHAPEKLQQGEFPDEAFAREFRVQDITLPVQVVAKLEDADPEGSERRKRLLQVWGETPELRNLHPGIHDAFRLPPLESLAQEQRSHSEGDEYDGNATKASSGQEKTGENGPIQPLTGRAEDQPPEPPPLAAEVAAWAGGGEMLQSTAQQLRDLIYRHINAHIDWEAEGMAQQVLTEDAWLPRSVVFAGRDSGTTYNTFVTLPIPLPKSTRARTAIALDGIVRANAHGSWAFEGGGAALRAFGVHLANWAEAVLHQLRAVSLGGEADDPVPSAAEALYLGASLFGVPSNDSLSDQLSALLLPLGDVQRDDAWGDLQRSARRHRDLLHALLLAQASVAKGSGKPRMLDVPRLAPLVSHLSARISPEESLPQHSRYDKARNHVEELHSLPELLDETIRHAEGILDLYRGYLDVGQDMNELVMEVGGAKAAAIEAGVFDASGGNLDYALDQLRSLDCESHAHAIESFVAAERTGGLLRRLATWSPDDIQYAVRLLESIDSAMQASLRRAEEDEKTFAGERSVENRIASFEAELERSEASLSRLLGRES